MVRGAVRKKALEDAKRAKQNEKSQGKKPKGSALRSCLGVLVFGALAVCFFGCGALFFMGDAVVGWVAGEFVDKGSVESFVVLHEGDGKVMAVEAVRKTVEGRNSAKQGFEVAACWISIFDLSTGERTTRTKLPKPTMCKGGGVQLLAGGDVETVWALAHGERPFGIDAKTGEIAFTVEDLETRNRWLEGKLSGGATRNRVDPKEPSVLWNKVDYMGTVRIDARDQTAERDRAGEQIFRDHIKLCGTDHSCAYESGHGKDWARAGAERGKFSGLPEGADGRLLDTNATHRVLTLRKGKDDVLVWVGQPKSGDISLEAVSREDKRSRWKKSARDLTRADGMFEVDGASVFDGKVVVALSGYLVVLDERTGRLLWAHRPDFDTRLGTPSR